MLAFNIFVLDLARRILSNKAMAGVNHRKIFDATVGKVHSKHVDTSELCLTRNVIYTKLAENHKYRHNHLKSHTYIEPTHYYTMEYPMLN